MEKSTPLEQEKMAALSREAQRIEEDATYSSKSHFNAEQIWERCHYWLGVPATVCAAIAGGALFKSHDEVGSAFALLASLLTGLMTFLKPNERATMHRVSAGQFLALRNDARIFREIELLQANRWEECAERLKTLSATCNELNQKGPSIPRCAFVAARKGIEEGEATHKVDQKG